MNAKRIAYDRLRELLLQSESATYSWVKDGTDAEWNRRVKAALRRLFGEDSEHVASFAKINYTPIVFGDTTPDSTWVDSYLSGMKRAQALIRAAISEAEDYEIRAESSDDAPTVVVSPLLDGEGIDRGTSNRVPSNQVFLVHGHDGEMTESVARFIERLGLQPIVLSEQANAGDTVIEKFERRSDVSFAVILLSPDDIGASRKEPENLQSRARQNVVLELGYFLGSLGRRRVCPIVRGRLELPSDLHGLVYVTFDGDAWKIELVKELKAAGIEVDANRAF